MSVVVNVAQLLMSEVGTSRQFDLVESLPPLDEDIRLTAPVKGMAQLIRTNLGIVVRGHFTTSVELECSRCLEPAVQDLSIDFVEEYLSVVDIMTGAPLPIPSDNASFLISDKHELDLSLAVREYGLLELPMKPLCRADCAGLCPQCGANRNVTPCHCVAAEFDERFAVLRALLAPDHEIA